jgi:hypothetical protein
MTVDLPTTGVVSILSSRPPAPVRRGPGHGHGVSIPTTLFKLALVAVLLVLPAVEAGSWFLTRVQLDDDAAGAAVTAADSVGHSRFDGRAAETAYDVAEHQLERDGGGDLDRASLRLSKDGTVRFTAQRAAPSVLLGHLEWTKHLMVVSVEAQGRSIDPADLPLVPHDLVTNLPRSTP